MNYPLISEYIESIRYAEDNFATLTNLRPVLDDDGNPIMSAGNFAVVFKLQDIKTKKHYKPSKKTAVAFAIALELSMDETTDLLQRAGIALSPSSKFDLIVGYYISHGIYDMMEINLTLFKNKQECLGALQ